MKVSVVVTTLNSMRTIEQCLKSIIEQTYNDIELIVVDNYSSDATLAVAKKYADSAVQGGVERSAQRNIGIRLASGFFVCFIDSDMILEPDVIEKCVQVWQRRQSNIAIPEISFGDGFWARCKAFERSFYAEDSLTAAARFFEKTVLIAIEGYDESLHAAEDWDLSIRAGELRPLEFAPARIRHDEGRLRLLNLIRKKFYYGTSLRIFLAKHGPEARRRLTPMRTSLLSNLGALARNPISGAGLIVMKAAEMGAGVFGIALSGRGRVSSVYKKHDAH